MSLSQGWWKNRCNRYHYQYLVVSAGLNFKSSSTSGLWDSLTHPRMESKVTVRLTQLLKGKVSLNSPQCLSYEWVITQLQRKEQKVKVLRALWSPRVYRGKTSIVISYFQVLLYLKRERKWGSSLICLCSLSIILVEPLLAMSKLAARWVLWFFFLHCSHVLSPQPQWDSA